MRLQSFTRFLLSHQRRQFAQFALALRLRLQPEILVDAAAYRAALSGANLIAGYLQGEERSKRLVSHAVSYSEWLRWNETSRSQLISALEQVQ